MRKGHFMLDLSSIQEDYLKEYLSLEHLRAFIYKSKLDKSKTKGINEDNFYGVTCAQDVLALFKREEGRNNIPRCYLLHPISKSLDKVEYSHLISYLEYLVYTQIDTTSFRHNPDAMTAYEIFCENESIKYENENIYFRRDEIENMIGAKIPYIENLSDVENVDLIPLQKEKAESVPELNQEIERLKSELEEKDKKITELQTALGDKNVPILLGAHRNDDPLKIAIEVRNKYWASYPDNVKSNTQIRDYIIRDYSVTKTFATEIEKIACPIDRKKN